VKTSEILTGIQLASCKRELSLHIDSIEKALDEGQCNYNALDEQEIAKAIEERLEEFRARVFH